MEIEEKTFRNRNNHGKADEPEHAPIVARFIRSPEARVVEEPPSPEPEAGVRANGQVYVAG